MKGKNSEIVCTSAALQCYVFESSPIYTNRLFVIICHPSRAHTHKPPSISVSLCSVYHPRCTDLSCCCFGFFFFHFSCKHISLFFFGLHLIPTATRFFFLPFPFYRPTCAYTRSDVGIFSAYFVIIIFHGISIRDRRSDFISSSFQSPSITILFILFASKQKKTESGDAQNALYVSVFVARSNKN